MAKKNKDPEFAVVRMIDYFMTLLHVGWREPAEDEEIPEHNSFVDYSIESNKADPSLVRAVIYVACPPPEVEDAAGFEVEAEICGVFSLTKDVYEDDEKRAMAEIQCLLNLYEILRGELGAHTGSFPRGKFLLQDFDFNGFFSNIKDNLPPNLQKALMENEPDPPRRPPHQGYTPRRPFSN